MAAVTWSHSEWQRIEKRALEHIKARLELHEMDKQSRSTLWAASHRAIVDGSALELRQWAGVAGASPAARRSYRA